MSELTTKYNKIMTEGNAIINEVKRMNEGHWERKCNEIIKSRSNEDFKWINNEIGLWYPSLKEGISDDRDFDEEDLSVLCEIRAMGTIAIGRLSKKLQEKFGNTPDSYFETVNTALKMKTGDPEIELNVSSIGSTYSPSTEINNFIMNYNGLYDVHCNEQTILDWIILV